MTCLTCDNLTRLLQKIIFKKMLMSLIAGYWFELENNYLNCNKTFKTEKILKTNRCDIITL